MNPNKIIKKTAFMNIKFCYHFGIYLVILYFLIVPKLAVSNGLLSDAKIYKLNVP
jgi:hypothetical protein